MRFMKAINRDILKLAVPSILANITVPIVGMVDIAVAGHLDGAVATMIGGIAIGTMLFDLLYWNFGFLRVGTGGLTAQAFGKEDRKECAIILTRALGISLSCALILIAIQWIFVKAAFMVVDCTPEVRELASQYFYIRIWAAPATLSLYVFKGFFIGTYYIFLIIPRYFFVIPMLLTQFNTLISILINNVYFTFIYYYW